MPLHVARLRDSDLVAEENPEACWYAVLLWCASWHQVPAGSLPDSDDILCRLVGLGRDLRTLRRHKSGALRGWVKCSDGRLYHPVVAEQVVSAWDSKLRQRHRTLCAAVRKHNERKPDARRDSPDFDVWMSLGRPCDIPALVTALSHVTSDDFACDIPSKGQGERQGQGDYNSDPDGSGASAPPAPPDPEKVMFDAGRRLLAGGGMSAAAAGTMLGKWKRDHGAEAVITALGKAQREGAIDPKSFIEGCLRNGQRTNGHRSIGRTASAALSVFGEPEREAPRPQAAELRRIGPARG